MNIVKELAALGIRAHFIPQGKIAKVGNTLFTEHTVMVSLNRGGRPEEVAKAIARHIDTVLGGAREVTIRDTDTVISSGGFRAYTAVGIGTKE